jgi:hypothetical protein
VSDGERRCAVKQFMAVVSFVATGGDDPAPVAAVIERLPLVNAQAFRPQLRDGAGVVFIVAAGCIEDAPGVALHEVGTRCRPIVVRAGEGPDWFDPRSLEVCCDVCGPDHHESVYLEHSVCADAAYDRYLGYLLDSAGWPVRSAAAFPASACV